MGFILNYLLIVLLVIEIAVVLMRATGLDHDVSRFQVVSLMTSTGFTTKESELILGHPVRRRIGIFLILFGLFSFAVIISAISSILVPDFNVRSIAVISAVLALLLLIVRMPIVRAKLVRRFEKPLEEKFDIHELPIEAVMLHGDADRFLDLPIGEESRIVGMTIAGLCDQEMDVSLLFIKRGTVYIRRGRSRTPIEAGDILYLYGDQADIERVFGPDLVMREDRRQHDIGPKSLL